ncbi:MAG: alkaline phosphatase D family protein [Chitinophagales bacterium]
MQANQRTLLIVCFYSVISQTSAQRNSNNLIVSGPMMGQIELRTATIWLELSPTVKKATIRYWKKNDPSKQILQKYSGLLGKEFNPVKFEIGGLDINYTYVFDFILNDNPSLVKGEFSTKDLWQWRKPAPDFTFLTGSCAYFNEPRYDRPGKPYGADSSIFETMAKTPASFMLWLGDNWYTREADYSSTWGLWYRASHDRRLPVMQAFWKSMPHYAIWDDHDYGPDDADGSYILKDSSRQVFMHYWSNPSYGQDGEGTYTQYAYSDMDFFLTDDRYFRSSDKLLDSINGKPNQEKHFFGRKQLDWLKNALATSEATFKLIVVGSQVLNRLNGTAEGLDHYPAEFEELMNFLDIQKIKGVIFLTGDRHHSEVVFEARPGNYTLYDITSSPLTSGISLVRGIELNNHARVPGTLVEVQNFTRITVTGPPGNRKLLAEFLDAKGEKKGEWAIGQEQLGWIVKDAHPNH